MSRGGGSRAPSCAIAAGRQVKALVELAVIVHVHVTLMWLRDSALDLGCRH
jgi:hypothetical protein